mmetsp:Transcript_48229/g.113360  ORF Transcript_48229/g.113360 Transcript_48229/m.113360 type:complete len:221 (-) Transcript_48229:131-793(-)
MYSTPLIDPSSKRFREYCPQLVAEVRLADVMSSLTRCPFLLIIHRRSPSMLTCGKILHDFLEVVLELIHVGVHLGAVTLWHGLTLIHPTLYPCSKNGQRPCKSRGPRKTFFESFFLFHDAFAVLHLRLIGQNALQFVPMARHRPLFLCNKGNPLFVARLEKLGERFVICCSGGRCRQPLLQQYSTLVWLRRSFGQSSEVENRILLKDQSSQRHKVIVATA